MEIIILLEAGPGHALTTLVKHQGFRKNQTAVTSLDGQEGKSDLQVILTAVGQLWINGIEPDWKNFYSGQERERISVPSYAFDAKRYWVDPIESLTPSVNLPISNPETKIQGIPLSHLESDPARTERTKESDPD